MAFKADEEREMDALTSRRVYARCGEGNRGTRLTICWLTPDSVALDRRGTHGLERHPHGSTARAGGGWQTSRQARGARPTLARVHGTPGGANRQRHSPGHRPADRKSTRLNSSHVEISYAVF